MYNLVAAFLTVFFCSYSFAAGALSGSATTSKKGWVPVNGAYETTLTFVDDTTGTTGTVYIPDTLSSNAPWVVSYAEVDPGATAPTDNYDIVIAKTGKTGRAQGVDCFQGGLLNLDTSSTEIRTPLSAYVKVEPGDTLTFTLSGNSVNNATGIITIGLEQ